MLKKNKLSRNQKGFSLIELMVAVAILALAAFGIFQSYQAGFWGMSDARARTIATNLAQEKLEEVKGKSLIAGNYPDPDNPIIISGKEFNVIIEVNDIKDEFEQVTGLKKIKTEVSWQKRNGDVTSIIVEGLQSKALAPPNTDIPTAILISANPIEMDIGESSTIKVTILDQDNYPIAFEGQIDLSMIPDNLGTLENVNLVFNGESFFITTFNANTIGDAGDMVINAVDNAGNLIPDSVTITITGGEPANIDLSVNPESVIINGDTSVLTVRIEDENGFLADKWTGIVELAILSGLDTGELGDPPAGDTITLNFEEENIKTTLFTSSDQPGEAVITANDQGEKLTGDSKTIYVTSGPPYQLDIMAEPNSIFIAGYEDGPTSSTITVTIKNETGVPVTGFTGTVSLAILTGSESGTLFSNSLPFNGETSFSTTFTSTTTPGNVVIEATDTTSAEPLISDTESLTVATGPPQTIEIIAVPDIIINNGIDSSTLTISLKDFNGNYSSFDEDKMLNFVLNPNEGTVNNTPLALPAGLSQISTTYICANSEFEGNVNITVTCEGISEGSTTTVQVASRIVRPSEEPNIQYGGQWVGWWWFRRWVEDPSKVLFDIDVLGGAIDITQIDLAWKEETTLERLQGITVYEKDNEDNVKIERTWSYGYPTVPIYPIFYEINSGFSINQRLGVGTYTVELDYDQDIMDRTIVIQFHGTYLGKENIYQLEFLSPDLVV